jgi:hypothetical protein
VSDFCAFSTFSEESFGLFAGQEKADESEGVIKVESKLKGEATVLAKLCLFMRVAPERW